LKELETHCHRLTDTIENDLKKRLFVYQEEKDKWSATPKIKRIYKFHVKTANQAKVTCGNTKKYKIRTLKNE
jgi:hypothetical protein